MIILSGQSTMEQRFASSFVHSGARSCSPEPRPDRVQRPQPARGCARPPSGQQHSLKVRARERRTRRTWQPSHLHRCMPRPPPMRFGVAHHAGRRPNALRRAPRAPHARTVLAGCARETSTRLYEGACREMSNVFGEACRLEEPGSDVWTRRPRRLAARLCRETSWFASRCTSLYRRPSGGPF